MTTSLDWASMSAAEVDATLWDAVLHFDAQSPDSFDELRRVLLEAIGADRAFEATPAVKLFFMRATGPSVSARERFRRRSLCLDITRAGWEGFSAYRDEGGPEAIGAIFDRIEAEGLGL